MTNTCVICGAEIPEGTQVCYNCIKKNLGSDEWQAGYDAAKTEDREEIKELRSHINHLEQTYNMLALEAKDYLEHKEFYDIGRSMYEIVERIINK